MENKREQLHVNSYFMLKVFENDGNNKGKKYLNNKIQFFYFYN